MEANARGSTGESPRVLHSPRLQLIDTGKNEALAEVIEVGPGGRFPQTQRSRNIDGPPPADHEPKNIYFSGRERHDIISAAESCISGH